MTSQSLAAYDVLWSLEPGILPVLDGPRDVAGGVRVTLAAEDDPTPACSTPATVIWNGAADEPITLTRGSSGEYVVAYGDLARFHVPATLDEIRCHPVDPDAFGWRRMLFDTVMFCTALLRGRRLFHASAGRLGRGVVAIAAMTGGGKSSLAWELLRSGGSLVCDDVLTLAVEGPTVVCSPGPPLMNLPAGRPLEQRALEIAAFPGGGERWVLVANAQSRPAPLAAVVLLDRRPGQVGTLARLPPSPLVLLPFSIHLDFTAPGAADRFTLMSDVADRVPVYRLAADTAETPTSLAARLISQLTGDGAIALDA